MLQRQSSSSIFAKSKKKDKKKEDEVPDNDVYDSLLTQDEIQGCIAEANALVCLNELNVAVSR